VVPAAPGPDSCAYNLKEQLPADLVPDALVTLQWVQEVGQPTSDTDGYKAMELQ
jgi:hypothetical protein